MKKPQARSLTQLQQASRGRVVPSLLGLCVGVYQIVLQG